MRANTVLFFLPIFMISTLLQIQAQPLSDDQPLTNEDGCVSMSDETADKIKEIVHELIDFIETLAEKHEDILELKLVKLDIDNKHSKSDIDDQNTVLELFVNDCGKRFVNFLQNSTQDQTNDEIFDTKQSLDKGIEDKKRLKTSDKALSVTQDVTETVQTQKENLDSEVNIKEKSKTKVNNKINNKSKYHVVTNKAQDTIGNVASTTNANKGINRKDQTTTTINLNRKKKSNRNVETSNNLAENFSTKKVDFADTKHSSINSTNADYEPDTNTLNIGIDSEERNEEYESDINYVDISNSTDETSVDDSKEESTENNTNESVWDDENDNSADLTATENAIVEENTKSLRTSETQSEFENSYNNLKTDNDDNNNKSKQTTLNNEGTFLELLKQIIRNEVSAMKDNSTITNTKTHNDFGTRNDKNMNYDYYDAIDEYYYDYESRKKPELVILDLPDHLLNIRDRLKGQRSKRDPLLIYLQEQMGQQRIVIL